jgi:hypothetical protein
MVGVIIRFIVIYTKYVIYMYKVYSMKILLYLEAGIRYVG